MEPSSLPADLAPGPSGGGGGGGGNGNPLLIAEIAEKILDNLGSENDWDNLVTCFDVCQLWRSLTTPHILRLKPTRPPILVQDNLLGNNSAGTAYLDSVRHHPIFKSTKFSFKNADLGSPAVKELLKVSGRDMEELELWYTRPRPAPRSKKSAKTESLSASSLEELLRKKAPNITTLIIQDLPPSIMDANLFQQLISTNIGNIGQLNPLGYAKTIARLGLKRIVMSTTCDRPIGGDSTNSKWAFLVDLLAACPQLEEFELIDGYENKDRKKSNRTALRVVRALQGRGVDRISQLRSLKFCSASPKCLEELTRSRSTQLRQFSISRPIFPEDFIPYVFHAATIQEFLNKHQFTHVRMEYLQLPLTVQRNIVLPSMRNLVELRLYTDDKPMDPIAIAEGGGQGALDYATKFPLLRLLGLKGLLQNYVTNEIYPDPAFGVCPSCTSVEILQEMPVGVDQPLMCRIGRLFPHLTIIRTPILRQHENLLTAVWEFCPNVTELFLTFDNGTSSGMFAPPLDFLFSGILEPLDIKQLRYGGPQLPPRALQAALESLNGREREPFSLCSLKKLRRLCIDGPSKTLGGRPGDSACERLDRLSDVFGCSTLAKVARSREFEFFQVGYGLTEMTEPCVKLICDQTGLKRVGSETLSSGLQADIGRPWPSGLNLRLIRPGLGLEALGPELPPEWYGL